MVVKKTDRLKTFFEQVGFKSGFNDEKDSRCRSVRGRLFQIDDLLRMIFCRIVFVHTRGDEGTGEAERNNLVGVCGCIPRGFVSQRRI